MTNMNTNLRRTAALTAAWMLGMTATIGLMTEAAIAQSRVNFNPPGGGAPGNRESGASRSGNLCFDPTTHNLMAVAPDSNLALTTDPYPTFFAYVPPTDSGWVEFELYGSDSGDPFYTVGFPAPPTGGVISVDMLEHASLPPLEVDQQYRWSFALVCDRSDYSSLSLVEGYTERVDVDPTLASQLESATSGDRPVVYAASGLWQDTLSSLADLIRDDSVEASAYAEDWSNLLRSVGLEAIADEPLL